MKNSAVVLLMLAVIAGFGRVVDLMAEGREWIAISEPPTVPGFQVIDTLPHPFAPDYQGAARLWLYQLKGGDPVFIVVVFYQSEAQGRELVNSENTLIDKEQWRRNQQSPEVVKGLSDENSFNHMVYRNLRAPAITVFSQYRFGQEAVTSTHLQAKLLALRDMFLGTNASAQLNLAFVGEAISLRSNQLIFEGIAKKLIPAINREIGN